MQQHREGAGCESNAQGVNVDQRTRPHVSKHSRSPMVDWPWTHRMVALSHTYVRLAGGGWATATATRDIATTVNICVWVRVKARSGG
jgi:hypothetical protein